MGYLLDTNVWIDIERGREDRLINKAASVSNDDLLLSTVVLGGDCGRDRAISEPRTSPTNIRHPFSGPCDGRGR